MPPWFKIGGFMDFRRLLQAIQFRKGLFVSVFFAALAIVVVIPQASNRQMYLSTARILLTPPSQAAENYGVAEGRNQSDQWLSSEATLHELVTSERLLSRVLQVANRNESWLDIQEHVVLEPLSSGKNDAVNLFSLGIEDTDPESTRKLSEILAKEFVSYVEELSAREFANTRRFLEELVAEAREKVDSTEEQLLKLTTSHASEAETEKIGESQDDLESERQKVKQDLSQAESELAAIESFLSGRVDTPPWLVMQGDTSLKQLEQAVAADKLKLLELQQLYTDENDLVKLQKAKLAKVDSVYNARLHDYVRALRNEKAQLVADGRSRLASINERLTELQNRQLTTSEKRQVAKLQRQLTMWEENHLNLVKQLYQARILEQSSRRQGAITILQAPVAGLPVKGNHTRNLIQALVFGLPFSFVLALGAVMAADYFQASLRILPKIESRLQLPVLAVIPSIPDEMAENWESYKRLETMPKRAPRLEERPESSGPFSS